MSNNRRSCMTSTSPCRQRPGRHRRQQSSIAYPCTRRSPGPSSAPWSRENFGTIPMTSRSSSWSITTIAPVAPHGQDRIGRSRADGRTLFYSANRPSAPAANTSRSERQSDSREPHRDQARGAPTRLRPSARGARRHLAKRAQERPPEEGMACARRPRARRAANQHENRYVHLTDEAGRARSRATTWRGHPGASRAERFAV